MKFGDIKFKSRLMLAPMAGFSDNIFRELCFRYGAALTVTEMVSAKGLFYNSEASGGLLAPSGTHPEAAQLFGSSPEIMARQVQDGVFAPFDIIDINMGCPARKITSNGEGSALMKDIVLSKEIVSAVSEAAGKPVTVKIRAGWDGVTAPAFARAMEEAGAQAITVHGRTAVMGYSGKCDRSVIRAVKESVSVPVIGNGDVTDGSSAAEMLAETGCDYIMIGRAAQGRPWIFAEINSCLNGGDFSLSFDEKLDLALEHGIRLAEARGERTAMLQMRKAIACYTHGMFNAASVRASIEAVSTCDDLRRLISRLKQLNITHP